MLTEQRKKILRTYAECSMNTAKTARKLHYHRNNIDYHLDCVRKQTGLDPRNFFGLIELLKMVDYL